MNGKPLIVVGSGDRVLREYALAAMGERAPLVLFSYRRPTWEKPYLTGSAIVDLENPEHIASAAAPFFPGGMITYDERLVESTAKAAEALGLPGPGAARVALCKDKSAMRTALDAAGLSPVGHGTASKLPDALAIAGRIGYPVVLKPRALSGSIGVIRVDSPAELERSFAAVLGARAGLSAPAHPGVLIEEFLDGPEYSLDAVTRGGLTRVLVVAEKMVGFPPFFEETGHLVPGRPADCLDEAVELVIKAHGVLGLDSMTTHTEFRLTPSGPRIVEINARLGGDLIPYLGGLALGVDAPGAAADVALGREPRLTGTATTGAAAVRLFYPPTDLRISSVELPDVPGLDRFAALAKPGEPLRLPPRGFLSRAAVAVITGADHEECLDRVAEADRSLVLEGEAV